MQESNVVLLKSAVQLTCDIVRSELEEIHSLMMSDRYANSCAKIAECLVEVDKLKDNVGVRCFFTGTFNAYVLLNTDEGVREILENIAERDDES